MSWRPEVRSLNTGYKIEESINYQEDLFPMESTISSSRTDSSGKGSTGAPMRKAATLTRTCTISTVDLPHVSKRSDRQSYTSKDKRPVADCPKRDSAGFDEIFLGEPAGSVKSHSSISWLRGSVAVFLILLSIVIVVTLFTFFMMRTDDPTPGDKTGVKCTFTDQDGTRYEITVPDATSFAGNSSIECNETPTIGESFDFCSRPLFIASVLSSSYISLPASLGKHV